jgi:hypothetical protein
MHKDEAHPFYAAELRPRLPSEPIVTIQKFVFPRVQRGASINLFQKRSIKSLNKSELDVRPYLENEHFIEQPNQCVYTSWNVARVRRKFPAGSLAIGSVHVDPPSQ